MLLMYYYSGRIWRWTKIFLTVLSTIVAVILMKQSIFVWQHGGEDNVANVQVEMQTG